MKEYVVPAPESAGRVGVANSDDLITATQNGCIHCIIVRSALNAVHAG
jgi:hypothetical protein